MLCLVPGSNISICNLNDMYQIRFLIFDTNYVTANMQNNILGKNGSESLSVSLTNHNIINTYVSVNMLLLLIIVQPDLERFSFA
jgi:hypothetical protein